MTGKLKIKIVSNYIYLTNKDNVSIRYDLKNKQMEKKDRKNNWVCVEQQYTYFRGYSIENIECEEEDTERFRNLILQTSKMNPRCESLSTFISRMGMALVYENYVREGITTECYVTNQGRGYYREHFLTKPLDFYHKNIITFIMKNNIEVNCNFEKAFIEDYEFMENMVNTLNNIDSNAEDKKEFLDVVLNYRRDDIKRLVNDYRYDLKSLIRFIYGYLKPFENIDATEGISLLKDYVYMSEQIGRNYKKYPIYLKSTHDIILSNYNTFKKTYNETLFKSLMKKELEIESKEFCIKVPESTKEIVDEGIQNNHCVSSYVDRILSGSTYIFFMRKTEFKDKSLLTLELQKGEITQAKGSYNRSPTKEEIEFLTKYAKEKEIALKIPNVA